MDAAATVVPAYRHDLLHGHAFATYRLVADVVEQRLAAIPELAEAYGHDVDAWACRFLYYRRREHGLETLEVTDEERGTLNPQIVKALQHSATDAEFAAMLTVAVRRWMLDMLDRTRRGRLRRVLERTMETSGRGFVNVDTTRWALADGPTVDSAVPPERLWVVAARCPIAWPKDQAYHDFVEGRRKYQPKLPRAQVADLLETVLREARGSVDIDTLTDLVAGQHPIITGGRITVTGVGDATDLEDRAPGEPSAETVYLLATSPTTTDSDSTDPDTGGDA